MKKEQQKQLLKDKFIDSGSFIGAIAFSIFPVAKVLQDGDAFPLLINGMIILVTIIVSIWSYLNRVKATAFLIGRIVRFGMITLVIFAVQFSLTTPNNAHTWLAFSSSLVAILMIFGLYIELHDANNRMEILEKSKKIDFKTGHFNILVIPRQQYKTDKYLMLSSAISPVVVVICLRIYRVVSVDKFFIIALVIVLSTLLSFYFARMVGILIDIYLWQKRYGVIFTTEYREFVKEN
jgi:hypothetical protein